MTIKQCATLSATLILGAMLNACADLPEVQPGEERAEVEYPTGSNIPRKARKSEKTAQLTEAEKDEMRRQATIVHPSVTPTN